MTQQHIANRENINPRLPQGENTTEAYLVVGDQNLGQSVNVSSDPRAIIPIVSIQSIGRNDFSPGFYFQPYAIERTDRELAFPLVVFGHSMNEVRDMWTEIGQLLQDARKARGPRGIGTPVFLWIRQGDENRWTRWQIQGAMTGTVELPQLFGQAYEARGITLKCLPKPQGEGYYPGPGLFPITNGQSVFVRGVKGDDESVVRFSIDTRSSPSIITKMMIGRKATRFMAPGSYEHWIPKNVARVLNTSDFTQITSMENHASDFSDSGPADWYAIVNDPSPIGTPPKDLRFLATQVPGAAFLPPDIYYYYVSSVDSGGTETIVTGPVAVQQIGNVLQFIEQFLNGRMDESWIEKNEDSRGSHNFPTSGSIRVLPSARDVSVNSLYGVECRTLLPGFGTNQDDAPGPLVAPNEFNDVFASGQFEHGWTETQLDTLGNDAVPTTGLIEIIPLGHWTPYSDFGVHMTFNIPDPSGGFAATDVGAGSHFIEHSVRQFTDGNAMLVRTLIDIFQDVSGGVGTGKGISTVMAVMSNHNIYEIRFVPGPTNWQLFKNGTSVATLSAVVAQVGAFASLDWEMWSNGTNLKVYLNGSQVGSVSEAGFIATMRTGLINAYGVICPNFIVTQVIHDEGHIGTTFDKGGLNLSTGEPASPSDLGESIHCLERYVASAGQSSNAILVGMDVLPIAVRPGPSTSLPIGKPYLAVIQAVLSDSSFLTILFDIISGRWKGVLQQTSSATVVDLSGAIGTITNGIAARLIWEVVADGTHLTVYLNTIQVGQFNTTALMTAFRAGITTGFGVASTVRLFELASDVARIGTNFGYSGKNDLTWTPGSGPTQRLYWRTPTTLVHRIDLPNNVGSYSHTTLSAGIVIPQGVPRGLGPVGPALIQGRMKVGVGNGVASQKGDVIVMPHSGGVDQLVNLGAFDAPPVVATYGRKPDPFSFGIYGKSSAGTPNVVVKGFLRFPRDDEEPFMEAYCPSLQQNGVWEIDVRPDGYVSVKVFSQPVAQGGQLLDYGFPSGRFSLRSGNNAILFFFLKDASGGGYVPDLNLSALIGYRVLQQATQWIGRI